MKTKLFILILILLFGSLISFGQVRIKMQKDGGVYKIPCVVNGLRLKFIFDTGASNVCISLSEATLMLENGYLDKKDIIGIGKAQIADGSIISNTRIILREIKINDLILKDVEAVVINELKAPLLLGQSAIEKLGKIQIEGDEIIVLNAKGNDYTQIEIDEIINQGLGYFNDSLYAAAAESFKKLYDNRQSNDMSLDVLTFYLAISYYSLNKYSIALQYFFEIQDKAIGNNDLDIKGNKGWIFNLIGTCFYNLQDYNQAELYIQKSKPFLSSDVELLDFYSSLVDIYAKTNNCDGLKKYILSKLACQLKLLGYTSEDLYSGEIENEVIANSLYVSATKLIKCNEKEMIKKFMVISAVYGNDLARKYCGINNIDYMIQFYKNKDLWCIVHF